MGAANEREAVKKFLLDWDPTAFDEEGSRIVPRCVLASGRMMYRYYPFDIKPHMRIGTPIMVSANPNDLEDVRFATDEEFYEYMTSPLDEQGELE